MQFWQHIFLVSNILLLFQNNFSKYEELVKHLPYCAQHSAITSLTTFLNIIKSVFLSQKENHAPDRHVNMISDLKKVDRLFYALPL